MKLKLDLHEIYSDGRKIEEALQDIIEQAVTKRASEVEIIPGKGSGALKKSVLRFLDRPDIKAQYHRVDKDSDNWGRLFVYFRHESFESKKTISAVSQAASYTCFCCQAENRIACEISLLHEYGTETRLVECPSCGSPNLLTIRANRQNKVIVSAISGYK